MSSPKYNSQNWMQDFSDYPNLPYEVKVLCEFWSDRACGLACASSAIEFLTGRVIHQMTLFNECVRIGGYSAHGWKHNELAQVISKYGVNAVAKKIELDECCNIISQGGIIIASVSHQLPDNGLKGGHLILLHDQELIDHVTIFSFMDPSAWGRINNKASLERISKSFSNKGIVLTCNVME
ncbi:hypothetical protein ACGVWS_05380 [Enterobacteriaceae bacterium LUAb1]